MLVVVKRLCTISDACPFRDDQGNCTTRKRCRNKERVLGERVCRRCGRTEHVQEHHIKQRKDGGGDEPENKEDLCDACHDFEHARREIVHSIESWEEKVRRARKVTRRQAIKARLDLLGHRLEVLEALNKPEAIARTGKYTSYWVDETTHNVIPVPPDSETAEIADQPKLL
jgi:hypothetical protein